MNEAMATAVDRDAVLDSFERALAAADGVAALWFAVHPDIRTRQFEPEQHEPDGAGPTDRLAAFLGDHRSTDHARLVLPV